jgi:hypothetical protein
MPYARFYRVPTVTMTFRFQIFPLDNIALKTTRTAFFIDKINNYIRNIYLQSDQQESKSEQALQIIGHVVAESYANKRSKHGRRQFVVSNASL